jgi:glycosyltransferase involved in cell wall biosynthesis
MTQLTVVIPIHNRFKYVDQSIESVYKQTFQNFELILVDDCSDDNYLESKSGKNWIKKFSTHPGNLKIIRNTKNVGSGLSRQRGLEIAKGEFIAFLDSDDYWTIDFLSVCVKTLKENPNIAATYVTSYYVNGSLRNKTNLEFTEICSTLIKEYRVWQTGSLLWRKQFVAIWQDLSSNQDSLFEFNSGLINDKIKLTCGPNLYINKDTGYHTSDRVNKGANFINQLVVFSHYKNNIKNLPYSYLKKRKLSCLIWIHMLKRLLFLINNSVFVDLDLIHKTKVRYKIDPIVSILLINIYKNLKIKLPLIILLKVFKVQLKLIYAFEGANSNS